MPSPPRVTIAMPVHNARAHLRDALDSVIGQSYPHWELVVIDDGSNDGSSEMLSEYASREPRLRVFRQPSQSGIVAARNRALAEASEGNAYLAILDADDIALPDRLEAQVAFMEAHPDHALVGGHTLIIDEHSRPRGLRRYPLHYRAICDVITRYNPFAQSAVLVRRTVLSQVGGYDAAFPRCQDYDLWLRIASRFPVANLDRPLIRYRISAAQGKRTHLRQTLQLTLRLQRRWLFHPRFFRVHNAAFVALEHALPLLPDAAILALFERVRYSS